MLSELRLSLGLEGRGEEVNGMPFMLLRGDSLALRPPDNISKESEDATLLM